MYGLPPEIRNKLILYGLNNIFPYFDTIPTPELATHTHPRHQKVRRRDEG